jgi:ketosteroid isomerase-like protein
MSEENEALVRAAYQAYGQGDMTGMLALVHPDLEWTYLDPAFGDPEPQTCHGRHQLLHALEGQAKSGLTSAVEEIASAGDRVMVVVHTPGLDQRRARSASDRNYLVLTLRHGQVVAMRACHDRAEAAARAGLGPP